jgi:hypothetical protein
LFASIWTHAGVEPPERAGPLGLAAASPALQTDPAHRP